jgi:hypothetical protein
MNKEQQDIILDVYREHCLEQSKYLTHGGTIQEFIKKIKTDDKFSEKWGLKIDERELSLEERKKLYEGKFTPGIEVTNDHWLNSKLTTRNIPTKLITLEYNGIKIESYE